jgi:GNAT superfamily N-acetyltransferase
MDHPIHDTSPSVLTRAIEENIIEFLVALGRAAGSEERHDPTIHWTIGGSPIDYHNCVVRAQLPSHAVETAIQDSIERFRAYHVPGSWHVGPSMRPPDLGSHLIAHGFNHAGDEPGMAIDIDVLRTDLPVADAELTIERVTDEHTLTVWTKTLAVGFGAGEQEAAWVGQMYRTIGLTDDQPWQHYLGWLHDRPVATSSMFFGAGVAGIYFVFTVPQARRRGIGAAMTAVALTNARTLGYRIGVLGSSTMGYPVYRRLGFQEYCQFGIYEWQLSTA